MTDTRQALAALVAAHDALQARSWPGGPAQYEQQRDELRAAWVNARAALSAQPVAGAAPAPEPSAQGDPVTCVTEEMVTAYLTANDAYWKRIDGEPTKLGKWRNGTPSEATRVSLEAALASAPHAREPLNFDRLQSVMAAHFGGRELTDDEADSAEAFARAIERAHGIGA